MSIRRGQVLMSHLQVAELAGISAKTLRRRVADGEWPEPHSMLRRTWFYRVDLIDQFLETGKWPEGTRFRAGAGRGRLVR